MHRQWKYGHLSWQKYKDVVNKVGRRLRYSTFFPPRLQRQSFFPHTSWVDGVQEWDYMSKVTPLVSNRLPTCMVYGIWWDVSQKPEGISWCSCHNILKVTADRWRSRWLEKLHPFLKKAERRTLGTTNLSDSSLHLGNHGTDPSRTYAKAHGG